MKNNNMKEKPTHYEILLRAFDKAQTALERSITNEKTAKHYLKTADRDITKTDNKILDLEYRRAKYRRKGRKAAFEIAKLRLKQWLKRHEDDAKLYQLTESASSSDNAGEETTAQNDASAATEAVDKTIPEAHKNAETSKKKETSSKKGSSNLSKKVANNAPNEPEDLTIIEGIGPKVNQYLQAGGIHTFAQLATSDMDTLKGILKANRNTISNPTTWAEQAQLVVEGKLDALKSFQEQLKGGRKV
jgi:predicted flap endonuclease-1-like 5' DNA nuclease